MRLIVAAAVTQLSATEEPLPTERLNVVLDYFGAAATHAGAGQHLAAALWCLCRHSANRKVILQRRFWVELPQSLLRNAMQKIRR